MEPDSARPDHDLIRSLTLAEFPRSAAYDPRWVMANQMGPNVLWLTEALTQAMDLQPGMRVLDLGCGKAISSIFLAREFGVRVWATDLWIEAGENWDRVRAAGLEDSICPIHVEAHALPFAEGFFDAMLSMDAYHYFGTDDLYLGYVARFIKPGGQLGIIMPGLARELGAGGLAAVPEHLKPYWVWDFCSFHSVDWWREHWARTGLVTVETADAMEAGWRHWLRWLDICQAQGRATTGPTAPGEAEEAEMLRADAGRNLGFTRLVARRNPADDRPDVLGPQ